MSFSGQDHPLCHMFCLACFTVTGDVTAAAAQLGAAARFNFKANLRQKHVMFYYQGEAGLIQHAIMEQMLYFQGYS